MNITTFRRTAGARLKVTGMEQAGANKRCQSFIICKFVNYEWKSKITRASTGCSMQKNKFKNCLAAYTKALN